MNEHEESNEQVGAYVLDALPVEERASFEAHLQECELCRVEVSELRQVVNFLPLACEEIEPPTDLRARILAAANDEMSPRPQLVSLPGGRQPAGRRTLRVPRALFAVAAALVIAALGIWNVQLQSRVNNQPSGNSQAVAQLMFQQEVRVARLAGAAVMPIAGTAQAPEATAAMVQPKNGSAYFLVRGLPATSPATVYQLWLVRGTKPRSAGVFHYSGINPQMIALPMPATGFPLAAVTIEHGPHGSLAGPTGPKVLLGKLTA